MRDILNGRRVVGLTVLLVILYIFWRGPERFCVESFGTWLISPGIYVRLLPEPINHWLLVGLVKQSWIGALLCIAPIFLLVVAAMAGVRSLYKNSMPYALACLGLVSTVFSVYHYVQPLGISLIYF